MPRASAAQLAQQTVAQLQALLDQADLQHPAGSSGNPALEHGAVAASRAGLEAPGTVGSGWRGE